MKRKTLEDFVLQAEVKHKSRYDYSKVDYVNGTTKIEIICSEHGSFFQTPESHLSGRGCNECSGTKLNTKDHFIKNATAMHGDTYSYIKTDYVNSTTKVEIICGKHGAFFQAPKKHVLGQGCKKCGGKILKTTSEFVSEASMLHKNKYNYMNYKNDSTKIEIMCSVHGSFFQTPNKHLQGRGCPKCSNNISKPSTEWLDKLNVPLREQSFKFTNEKRKRQVDGYDPKNNTIYQFHGNYWHGNSKRYEPTNTHPIIKKTFGQLHEETLRRDQNIRDSGYNLVVCWEHDVP